MSATSVEVLMASLYTNHAFRRAFIADPESVLARFDLEEGERRSFIEIDGPGLVLAANSFAYKRWKANQWRHEVCRPFVAYDDVFDQDLLSGARTLFAKLIATGKCTDRDKKLTLPGLVSDLFAITPGNQINHEHVLLEQPLFSAVVPIWRRLFDLHLRDHHLIRVYFLRVSAAGSGRAMPLHPRSASYTTYVMLNGDGSDGGVCGYMNNGDTITFESMKAGRVVTFPSDVRQGIDGPSGTSDPALEFLCIKTLAAAV